MTEIWRELRWYPYYEVSNTGKLRTWWDSLHGRVLEQREDVDIFIYDGKNAATLYKDTSVFRRFIDELVAEAFCDNPDDEVTVRHINGDLLDDRATNLIFSDPVARDPVIATDVRSGARRWFQSRKEAAEALGVSASNISSVLSGRLWKTGRWTFKLGNIDAKHSGKAIAIVAENIETGKKLIFRSQSEAAKSLGLRQQNISSVLSGRLKKTGIWRFEYKRND